MDKLAKDIEALAVKYRQRLIQKSVLPTEDPAQYLAAQALGVSAEEAGQIALAAIQARLLQKYTRQFVEEAVRLCLQAKHPKGVKVTLKNPSGTAPKSFSVDFLQGTDALEYAWRETDADARTIPLLHEKLKVVRAQGFKPIRLVFYSPGSQQHQRHYDILRTIYAGVQGEFYLGEDAWKFVKNYTGTDLKALLAGLRTEG